MLQGCDCVCLSKINTILALSIMDKGKSADRDVCLINFLKGGTTRLLAI